MIENSLSLPISYNIRLEMWIFKTEHQDAALLKVMTIG